MSAYILAHVSIAQDFQLTCFAVGAGHACHLFWSICEDLAAASAIAIKGMDHLASVAHITAAFQIT